MILIPAIDIKDGKVVRLFQGRFDEVTKYEMSPVEAAQHWEKMGARWLHVVDLDGAKTGKIKNFKYIEKIVKSVNIPIEMGGGVRTEADIKRVRKVGVERVILGTKVIEDISFIKTILKKWGEKIAVSLDCSLSLPGTKPVIPATKSSPETSPVIPIITVSVGTHGWTSISQIQIKDKDSGFLKDLQDWGLRCLIFTDITKDGTLKGPNFQAIEQMLNVIDIPMIASGGISSIEDVKKLFELHKKYKHLVGAITGKAIYEGKLDFKKAVALCQGKD